MVSEFYSLKVKMKLQMQPLFHLSPLRPLTLKVLVRKLASQIYYLSWGPAHIPIAFNVCVCVCNIYVFSDTVVRAAFSLDLCLGLWYH